MGKYGELSDSLIAILNVRKSSKTVAEFVEYYYLLQTSTVGELAHLASRPGKRHTKAEIHQWERITCGNNPFISARIVSDLVISHPLLDSTVETIEWKEPPIRHLNDPTNPFDIVERDGIRKQVTRTVTYPIDNIRPNEKAEG